MGTTPLDDNSFLTHLATGRLILEDGRVPTSDPFTFTAAGADWVVQSWLPSALFASVERLGGPAAIIILRGVLSAALAGLVWTLTRPAQGLLARVAVAGAVVLVGTGLWAERPLLVGLIALALTLLAAEGRLRPVWLLLPIYWLWVNSHGSFPLGLLALATLAAGRRLDGDRPVVELAALRWALAGTAAAVLSPAGPRLLLFPLELLSRQDVLTEIREWQAPAFMTVYERAWLLLFASAVVMLVRRPTWRAALPLVVFGCAALVAARNLGPASLVLVPGLASALSGVGSMRGDERRPTFGAALVVVAAGLGLVAIDRANAGFDGTAYPVAAVSWLEREGMSARGNRLIHQDFVGNYLGARFGDRQLVFVDDRYDMLPKAVVDDYLTLLEARPGWAEVLERRRPDAVVWQIDEPLGQLLLASPAWRTVYADEDWLVATRR